MEIGELTERAETTARAVRRYVARGLLPAPRAGYGYEHLVRLVAIRALRAERLGLAEIRRRLAAMSLEEIEARLVSPDDPGASPGR